MDGVFSLLWQAKAFPKVLIPVWRILLDRLPTTHNLIKRGVVVNSPLCVLCNQSEEFSQHLFLDCVYARHVWFLCFTWIDILMVQNKDLRNHFENFHLVHMSDKHNQVWRGMWVAIVRSIWEQRNKVVFKQGVPDVKEIFQLTELLSWQWLKHRVRSFSYAFSDWHLNPTQCLLSVR